jgi:hypothetical protein
MGFLDRWIRAEVPNAVKCKSVSKIAASHGHRLRTGVSLTFSEAEGLFTILFIELAIALAIFAVIELGGNFVNKLNTKHEVPLNFQHLK